MNRSLLRARDIYLPTGWEPVDTAMAWVAFGSALPRWSWDEYLFVGAADLMTRAEVLHRLDQLGAEPGSLDAFLARAPERPAGNLDDLPPGLRNEVANLASLLQARQARRGGPVDPERFVRCSAKLLRRRYLRQFQNDTRWDGYGWDEDMEALAAAERDLLRRIAEDKIPAFGWPGGFAAQRRDVTSPRQRIPPEQCSGPVSFDRDGTLLPCLRSDAPLSAAPLFADILIPADKLLAEWPNPEPTEDEAARETSVPAEKRANGSSRLTPQVAAVIAELRTKLADDGLPRPGDGGQAALERWFVKAVEARDGEISPARVRVHVRRAIDHQRKALDEDR